MPQLLCILLTVLSLIHIECNFHTQTTFDPCFTRFPARPGWPDTLHFFLTETPAGVPLSDTLLRTILDSAQFESLHYGTGEARFWALGQFPLTAGLSAGIVQTTEFWFGKQSLLVFDPRQPRCLAVVELAHFYGGDGGQTASESWLFRSHTPLQLFIKMLNMGSSLRLPSPMSHKRTCVNQANFSNGKSHNFVHAPTRIACYFYNDFAYTGYGENRLHVLSPGVFCRCSHPHQNKRRIYL
jgi:hypothetical protein